MAHHQGKTEGRSLLSAGTSTQPSSLISDKASPAPSTAVPHDEERMNQKIPLSTPQALSSGTSRRQRRQAWRTLCLDYWILLLFAVIAVALVAALQLIGALSDRWDGLSTASPNEYYLWTFGPTAVLTLIGAFWARVEYRVKQLAPWHRLAKGPRPGEKTVLLDYVSPITPSAIFNAIKNKDYLVVLAGTASLLIKLLIVISTGLISLDFILVRHQDAPLMALEAFKSGSNHSIPSTGALAADVLMGIQYLDLSYPPGTTESYAYQPFTSLNSQSTSLIEATVDTFSADLDCEEAEFIIHQWQEIGFFNPYASGLDAYSTSTNIDVSSPSCLIKNINPPNPNNQKPGESDAITTYALFSTGACAHGTGLDANRILIITGEVKSGKEIVTSGNVSTGSYGTESNYTVLRSVQLICTPSYTILPSSVTLNGSAESSPGGVTIVPERNLPNSSGLPVHPWIIAEAQFNSFQAAYPWDQSSVNLPNYGDQQFTLIIDHNNLTFPDLLVPTTLIAVSTKFYKQVSVQVAKLSLMDVASSTLSGTIWSTEDRLVVRKLPLILMSVTSGVLIIIFVVMVPLSLRTPSLPHDPGSIAGLLAIFQHSPSLVQLLKGMGLSTSDEVEKALSGILVTSHTTRDEARQTLEIQVSNTFLKQSHLPASISRNEEGNWYRPFPVTTTTRASMFVIVIAIIAALETVLQLSHRNTGLADISPGNYLHYVWSFIPGLIMVSISLYSVAFDSALRTFAPYARLKTKGLYRDSLSVNFLAKFSLTLFYASLRTAQFAVFAATLAALLGKFLTIAVSGVYSVDNVADSKSLPIWYQGWFDPNIDSGDSTSDGLVASLVLQANLTYPQWTYDGLVFPYLGLDVLNSTAKPTSVNSSSLHVKLPAIQANLSCSLYDAKTLNATVDTSDYPDNGDVQISFYPPGKGPVNCGYGFVTPPNGIFGHKPGLFASVPAYPSNESIPTTTVKTRSCDNFAFAWGKLTKAHLDHLTVMLCSEYLQIVDVDATFRLPEFSIDASRPPVIDHSSGKLFAEESLDQNDNMIPDTGGIPSLDSWFNALVAGRDGIPFSYLGDLAFNEEVIAAIEVMQRRVRAQSLNRDIRILAPAERAKTPINGTVTNPYRLRLIQNAGSTRFLEGLLAAMLICGAAASYLMRTKQVLPKNPCSIAAVASLLADSELLNPARQEHFVPFEAEGMSAKELEAAAAFQTLTFRMGWFDKMDERGRRFTIDVVEVADSDLAEREREREKSALLHSDDGDGRSMVSEEGMVEENRSGSPVSEVGARDEEYRDVRDGYQREGERLEERRSNENMGV